MVDPFAALNNWVRILKPAGHLVITIPDWEMYEHETWPSVKNNDHKWCFTAHNDVAPCDQLIHVNSIIAALEPAMRLKSIIVIDDGFDPDLESTIDQTANPYNAECAIELIFRKYTRNYSFTG
jgi:hypothetical protein